MCMYRAITISHKTTIYSKLSEKQARRAQRGRLLLLVLQLKGLMSGKSFHPHGWFPIGKMRYCALFLQSFLAPET